MRWARTLVGIGLLTTGGNASAQIPALPGAAPPVAAPALPGAAAATGVGGVAGAAAAPAAAPPRNIWSFFMMTPEQKLQHQQNSAICRAKFCSSSIGQFVNNMLLPVGAVSGGLLGPVCPGPLAANPADLKKPPTSPQGAAARIKEEEAQTKAKIEAIEFLATVDCRYYPEAEAGLVTGLRAEKNECVRLAAAKALATGCCCTPKILKALTTTVNGSSEDKLPGERSERVRAFAFVALERCLRSCQEGEPEPAPEPPAAAKAALYESLTPLGPTADANTTILLTSYFAPGAMEPAAVVREKAARALARGLHLTPTGLAQLSGPRTARDVIFPAAGELPSIGEMVDRVTADRAPARPSWVHTLPRTAAPASMPVVTAPAEPRPNRGSLTGLFKEALKR